MHLPHWHDPLLNSNGGPKKPYASLKADLIEMNQNIGHGLGNVLPIVVSLLATPMIGSLELFECKFLFLSKHYDIFYVSV